MDGVVGSVASSFVHAVPLVDDSMVGPGRVSSIESGPKFLGGGIFWVAPLAMMCRVGVLGLVVC